MSDKLRRLGERRAAVWAQMRDIHERGAKQSGSDPNAIDGLSAEERAAWDRLDAEFVDLESQIAHEQRFADLDARFSAIDETTQVRTGPDKDQPGSRDAYVEAFGLWLRGGNDALNGQQRQLMQANWSGSDSRALGENVGTAGGYTVPQGFWAKVTETMKMYGGVLENVEVISTATGNDLPWPTNDDTGNTGALLAENTQASEQDLTFGMKTLRNWTYTSKIVRVSLQLMQDSGIDIESFVARKLGERLGRIYNTDLTTGNGAARPQGIVTGSTSGKTTSSGTAITVDELIDLQHSVDPAYRNERSAFMFNDSTFGYIRKLKDGQNLPIFAADYMGAPSSQILGHRYVINQDMASIATTNKAVLFGDFFAGYVARQVSGGQLLRLTERYADYLQVGFLGFGRIDGIVQDASAYKALTQA